MKRKFVSKDKSVAYFEKRLSEHGPGFPAIGYSRRGCLVQYQALRETLKVLAGQSVLDVGCGLGYGIYLFSDCDFFGIDASQDMIDGTIKIHGEKSKFFCATIYKFPQEMPPTYDWVVMSGIFNVKYEWDDVWSVVKESWERARIGIGVTFLVKPFSPIPEHTIFEVSSWLRLTQSLSSKIILRTDWSKNSGLFAAFR